MDHDTLSFAPMLIGLAGGLALFLHGMTMMSDAMRAMAGSRLKDIMARLAGNRWSALLTGIVVTAVVQSSSVTSVIAIGFVSAGILTLGQALVVIMGAAVGSTVTAQIIAFDVSMLAFLLVAIGFGMSLFKTRHIVSHLGSVILGLGVVFIGLSMMSGFMAPLRSYQPFIDLMASMSNPLLGILIGAAFTAVVQSSSATLGVIIALASQGLIPLHAGIALVFGANIGTTITGMLATIGQPRSALHAALGLFSFKVLLVVIWLPLMGLLERITRAVSPTAEGLALAEQLAFEVPRQVANVHMIVNLTTVLILLPFTNLLAALIVRVVGNGQEPQGREALAPALNPVLLEMPPMAIDAIRLEVVHLGERVGKCLNLAVPAILDGKAGSAEALQAQEQIINEHYAEITDFVEKLLQPELAPDVCRTAVDLVEAADYLESIGDLVAKEMIPLYRRQIERGAEIDPQTREGLSALSEAVALALKQALQAVAEGDQAEARSVLNTKSQVRSLERAAVETQIFTQADEGTQRLLAGALERELSESLRRSYSLIRRFVRAGTGLQRTGKKAAVGKARK